MSHCHSHPSGKEREMRQAVGELENQLRNATNLLAEFKHRAYMAEVSDTYMIAFIN
jgi:hypothetical protein